MQEYKVYEAEEKTTQSGKTLKKLVLQKEGAQWPIKNVTIWSDNPLYDQAVSGGTIVCDLLEKDSENINPNSGKPYKNRTVANPERQVATQQLNDINTGKIDQIFSMVSAIHKEIVKPKIGNTNVEYPQGSPEDVDSPF